MHYLHVVFVPEGRGEGYVSTLMDPFYEDWDTVYEAEGRFGKDSPEVKAIVDKQKWDYWLFGGRWSRLLPEGEEHGVPCSKFKLEKFGHPYSFLTSKGEWYEKEYWDPDAEHIWHRGDGVDVPIKGMFVEHDWYPNMFLQYVKDHPYETAYVVDYHV